MKDNFEKISQEYIRKYEDLESKYETLMLSNNDLLERNKKLELMAKFEGRFTSAKEGIQLDNLMITETGANEEKSRKENEDSGNYAGFMKVSMKPLKVAGAKRPVVMNFNQNKDLLLRDINKISTDILQGKEQYSKV